VIANEQQLAIVCRQLEELKRRRDPRPLEAPESAFQSRVEGAGIEKMIARLEGEIRAYENAKAGQVPSEVRARIQEDSFTEVASALVQLRVARGLRQEDLARALGKPQPSIARWEAEDYDGYTLKELSRLAGALGRQLQVVFVEPEGVEEPEQ
jgi:ribosome-binding protein aMBF1 (putative translation factor)